MKNNYTKSERMWNVCLTYVYRMFIVISILFTFGVGQMWAEPYIDVFGLQFYESSTNRYFKTGSEIKNDLAFGNKTSDFKLVYIYANAKKNGGNLCGAMYFKWWLEGTDGASNSGGVGQTSNSWSGDYCYEKFGTENGSSALDGLDFVQNRRPGNYTFKFYFSFEGNNSSSGCGSWYDCKYSGGDFKFTYTIPDPTITITGASSLVAGTSTNIQASISNYPVGSKITKVRVTGNLASAKETTGSATSLTVSSVTPNASGSNGITVTVTVKFGTGGTKDYVYNYNVTPPAVSDFTISATSGSLSGSGTSENPWLVTYNGSLTLGLSGATKAYADGNASPQYSTDGTNYGTTGSYISQTHSSITATTNQNWTYKARLKNNSSALYGSVKEKTVYWKVSTSSVTLHKNGGSSNGSATATHGRNTLASISAPSKTGYHVEGYYTNEACTTKVATSAGALRASTTYTTSGSLWNVLGAQTLYTKWTANTYTLKLNKNNGSADGSIKVTYDSNSTSNFTAVTRTGYNCTGYWTATSGGNKIINRDGTLVAYSLSVSSYINSSGNWIYDGTPSLNAQWTPKQCTVNFDFDESDDGYGSKTGATTSVTATYDAAMTSVTPPTAKEGYAFMGYWDAADGAGTQYYKADGTSKRTWNKDTESPTTLYAYYKQAEITGITLSPSATVAPSTDITPTTVTAEPMIYPMPNGTTSVCWKLLRSNGNEYSTTFSVNPSTPGNSVTFPAPTTSGSYKVAAILRLGGDCSGTVIDSVVTDLVVAGEHTVTIQYQDGSGRTLKDTIHITARPLEWTTAGTITPPTITGYTFARWEAGDGISIKNGDSDPVTTTTTESIQIKAIYDGTLTAVYNKKRMIYFYNTLNWESVYVYFYKNDSYWESSGNKRGSGASTTSTWTGTPYSEGKHGQMQPVSEGSKIYYFDAEAAGVNASYDDVVFTEADQHGYEFFYATKAARRGDYKTSLPMYVPLADQTPTNWNSTDYYDKGYWMNYPENTGYTLKIYNSWTATKETGAVREYPFPFSEDQKMPLKLDVEFNSGGSEYWFMIYRNDGLYYGNTFTYNQNYNTDQVISSGNNKCKLVTSAPGVYTIKLTYHDDGANPKVYNYYIDVDFPVAVGDYRIVYMDNATWSNGAHNENWYHPSDVIVKKDGGAAEAKKDIVSFYIAKGAGITTSMKFQYASAITNEGAITWTDVPSGTIDLSSYSSVITKAGVYNFHINQPTSGGIAVESVEPYTGTYYIRTDCAGNTKWDSYTTLDHQMTYSDYAAAGSDGFTHYYCHWVTAGTNVKFVIANDYSVCVSDTLEGDTYTTASLAANANIRFMYDERTNVIKRAYIAGSGNITDRFLVLEGDAKMYDENGNALTGDYQDHDKWGTKIGTDNHIILHDDENFVYERTIKVNASACAKLTAKYNNKVQYFKGGSGSSAADSVQLLGGTYAADKKYTMRIVYDFKTNRLVTAYIPEGTVDDPIAINADLMVIREHQEAGQQLVFTGDGELTLVKSVYGVMRFNRWTLNNRANPEDHDKDHSRAATINTYHPLLGLGSQKSMYERALYWISFPFDVNLSDVFGFGTYGVHWIMMDYNGAERARIGYWKDNDEGFWEYIEDRRGVTLKAGRGYVLALELELMQATDTINFWYNQIQQVELFFPSTSSTTGIISQTDVNVTVESHLCTIDRRTDKTVDDWNNDRRIADSHWNIIGVPSYANYGSTLTDAGGTVTWQTYSKTANLPFLYEWNANDNTYTAQSGSRYNFKAMHAYYVQYAGTLHWTLASATPPSIVARRTYAEEPENVEFRLELQQNDKMIDQTFVKMSNDEEVSANFAFGEDMDKEFNAGKANVYTFIEGYIPTAGNTLPMSDETTIVPVGVKITSAGEYTFAIPEGTEGIGVTLIDNVANTRTNLSALDYTVNLTAGTHDGRFLLEISPIHNAPTDIGEVTGDGLPANGARKVLIDGILYIVKGDKLYDVRGTMIK